MPKHSAALDMLLNARTPDGQPILHKLHVGKGRATVAGGRKLSGALLRNRPYVETGSHADVAVWVVAFPGTGPVETEANRRAIMNHKRSIVRIDDSGTLLPDGGIGVAASFKDEDLAAMIIAAWNSPGGVLDTASLDGLRDDIMADAWDEWQMNLVEADLNATHKIDIKRLAIDVNLDHYRKVYENGNTPTIDDNGTTTWPNHKDGLRHVAEAIRNADQRADNRRSRTGKTLQPAWKR